MTLQKHANPNDLYPASSQDLVAWAILKSLDFFLTVALIFSLHCDGFEHFPERKYCQSLQRCPLPESVLVSSHNLFSVCTLLSSSRAAPSISRCFKLRMSLIIYVLFNCQHYEFLITSCCATRIIL